MFSSILPNASSSKKFSQNGSSKQSNRFSIRVFKTPANASMPYPINAKFDVGYRPVPQPEQQTSNWYTTSTHKASYDPRPRSTVNYAIYPSATNETFIYEQSTCSKSDIFSNSDFDSVSTTTFSPSSAFSPAMSTDSTMTLKSPVVSELPLENPRAIARTATPAPRPNHPSHASTLQGPAMARTTSTDYHIRESTESVEERRARVANLQSHSATPIRVPASLNEMTQVPPAGGYILHLPEYAASTFSELEVEERDRIAKINAEYNSASSASFYTSSAGSGDIDMRRVSSTPQSSSAIQRDAFTRVATSQPLHPNLHFPIRPQEFDFPQTAFQHPSAPTGPAPFTHTSLRESPPSVERISSQLPPEQVPQASAQSQSAHFLPPLATENWSRDATFNSDQTKGYHTPLQNVPAQPFDTSTTSSRSAHATYGTSSHETTNPVEHRQDRSFHAPTELSRQRSIADRRSSFAGERSEIYGMPHGSSDYHHLDTTAVRGTAEPTGSSPRDYDSESRRDISSNSPPRGSQISPRDSASRAAIASDMRRHACTPSPRDSDERRPTHPPRRDSYAAEPSASSRDPHSKFPDGREIFKAGPLSSSPTQLRLSPSEFKPSPSYSRDAYGSPDNSEEFNSRTRVRSISFSNATRSTLPLSSVPSQSAGHYPIPILSKPSQPYVSGSSDPNSRLLSEYDRHRRSTSERSPPRTTETLSNNSNHTTYAEDDRHADPRSSAYCNRQTPSTSIPTVPHESQPSHTHPARQAATVQTASSTTTSSSSSKATERGATAPSSLHSRAVAQEPVDSRSRTSYLEHPQPNQYPHSEPVRRQSDGDRPYNTTSVLPRSATPYEKSGSASSLSSHSHSNFTGTDPSRPTTPAAPPMPEPQRRYSDGDQNPPLRPALTGRNSAPLMRSVRWNENLICPSPVFAAQRRKGWFNRRGDQLWTNDGAYKAAPADQQYPVDLADYPEHGEGWMNEEGTRIDMGHRLVPKPPLRSALKQAKA